MTNPENDSILELKGLTVSYGKKIIVNDFSLNLGKETVVLFGPSGCGKSTILKAILGTKLSGMKKEGTALLLGKDINVGSGEIRIVLQGPVVPGWIRVNDLCYLAAKSSADLKQDIDQVIEEILTVFGIVGLKDKYPHQLSGGQRQRVSLAIALIGEPKLLLLDEPTTFIDGATRLSIWQFIEDNIRPLNIPTLIVSHDPVEAIRLADRIIMLSSSSQVTDVIDVDLPHPRGEIIEKSEEYWVYRKRLKL